MLMAVSLSAPVWPVAFARYCPLRFTESSRKKTENVCKFFAPSGLYILIESRFSAAVLTALNLCPVSRSDPACYACVFSLLSRVGSVDFMVHSMKGKHISGLCG